MISRIDAIIGERAKRRWATAVARVDPLLRDLHLDGFDIAGEAGIQSPFRRRLSNPGRFGDAGAGEGGACSGRRDAWVRDLI